MNNSRKLPIGIQTFENLRKGNYLYIDKTDLIYQIATNGKPYFLSRPRRFGKKLFKTALVFSSEGRGLLGWKKA